MQNEELLLKTCARYIDSIKPNDKVLEENLCSLTAHTSGTAAMSKSRWGHEQALQLATQPRRNAPSQAV